MKRLRYTHTACFIHYCCSVAKSCLTLCNSVDSVHPQAPLSIVSWILLKFMSTESVMSFNHLIFCCSLLLLPSIFPDITIFSSESTLCIRRAKYHSFSFSISLSNDYSEFISFRIDWFDLLAVQSLLVVKSLLQHNNSKASILRCSAFFTVQVSHLYITTGKTIVWLYKPLSAKWCLCFLIHYLGLS